MKANIIVTLLSAAVMAAPSPASDVTRRSDLAKNILATRDSLCDGPECGFTNCVDTLGCSGISDGASFTGCILACLAACGDC